MHLQGCVPMGEADWERARITQGRPAAAAELTEDYSPLEAGLSHAVSLSKGCYIGQETLAKVRSAFLCTFTLIAYHLDDSSWQAGGLRVVNSSNTSSNTAAAAELTEVYDPLLCEGCWQQHGICFHDPR